MHNGSGVGGAIVGKALYTGNIDLSKALQALAQK
jgi:phosphoribosylformimino-5-aminoimidazole carboxamide ribotide isomerase